MPELPEVETTRRGLISHVCGRRVVSCLVIQPALRWPVPADFSSLVSGRVIQRIERRSKYLIFTLDNNKGFLWHLGMSGSLRLAKWDAPARKHDHVVLTLEGGWALRYHDPRRFGCLLWLKALPMAHPLLDHLGPEPLGLDFTSDYLASKTVRRKAPIKNCIMNASTVVGVGNIYANEALFRARIHPKCAAGRLSKARLAGLVDAIKAVLGEAIEQGGTTLRDFVNGAGEPGYFSQHLFVYGRAGEPCTACGALIRVMKLGQRSTFYCSACQRG